MIVMKGRVGGQTRFGHSRTDAARSKGKVKGKGGKVKEERGKRKEERGKRKESSGRRILDFEQLTFQFQLLPVLSPLLLKHLQRYWRLRRREQPVELCELGRG